MVNVVAGVLPNYAHSSNRDAKKANITSNDATFAAQRGEEETNAHSSPLGSDISSFTKPSLFPDRDDSSPWEEEEEEEEEEDWGVPSGGC
ncbi:hypothetical protein B296_00018715 [Ensete ventricosum]|uniref:Uncharacterized protein n=1 Tax=Ensete ventricosum TaxID=4639 RepID=A0A427ASL6_ENSVE|nr:hypothetical protein B296_00018715 [Ensete ventricosum]